MLKGGRDKEEEKSMRGANLFTPRRGRYSCESAAQTLEWMSAIADFLRPLKPLIDAHLVNFFKDRLWEVVDEEWMECLRKEPVENLLRIPSGFVMEHWPDSLKKFICTIESLVMAREQEPLQKLFPDLEVTTLDNVLAQGMNPKKKHEIEILAALANAITISVGAEEVIDVGAGQGHLAQVLCFQYQRHVTAIDASSHHSAITSERAERIKKYYAARLRKYQAENKHLCGPQIVTSQILSSTSLSELAARVPFEDNMKQPMLGDKDPVLQDVEDNEGTRFSSKPEDGVASLVLAGLHACGDLSVNMLRAFVESEQVKALVCIGCCYNLLSEECSADASLNCGFPMSAGARSHALTLGKSARDLSCQSADRWRNLSENDSLQNFHLHGFRAAFQMVLEKYFPEVSISCPSIGRQGKALRRQRMRRVLHSNIKDNTNIAVAANNRKGCCQGGGCSLAKVDMHQKIVLSNSGASLREIDIGSSSSEYGVQSKGDLLRATLGKYELFEEFSKNGMRRLGIIFSEDMDLHGVWNEAHPFFELIGPFWSVRASLGPLLETYLLLDRLLFLQEHACPMKVMMFPLFDPALSPRNMVIVAQK